LTPHSRELFDLFDSAPLALAMATIEALVDLPFAASRLTMALAAVRWALVTQTSLATVVTLLT
jgi:hypothetical protein